MCSLLELQPVSFFIDGFMYNNVSSNNMEIVDKEFREKFDDWAREQLEKKYNMELEKYRNYFYYIAQVNQKPEEGLKIFFDLCDEFFEEFHKNQRVKQNRDITRNGVDLISFKQKYLLERQKINKCQRGIINGSICEDD